MREAPFGNRQIWGATRSVADNACLLSRSARRHSIPTGLHANLTEGRPVGPARDSASSLLSSEGFFLGKMGFREALAAGDVALPQVRRRGCRSKCSPEGIMEVVGANAGAG